MNFPLLAVERHRIWVAVLLGASIWLWPLATGPLAQVWPNLFAWAAGIVLLNVLPRPGQGGDVAVAFGWLVAAAVSVGMGLLQYFDLEELFFPLISRTVPGYAYANVRQVNQLATLLCVGLLSILWAIRTERISRAALWLGGLLAIGLATTASRTGVIHLFVIGFFAVFWGGAQRTRALQFLAIVVAVFVACVLALPWLLQHFSGVGGRDLLTRMDVESTCSSRKVLWSNVLELVGQRPWTGWGWGELIRAHYVTEFKGTRFCDMLSNAHNLPLQLAVELGVPAAMLVCGFLLWAVWRQKPWADTDPTRQLAWGVLTLLTVHSLVEYPLWFANFQVMAVLSIWLLWRSGPQDASGSAQSAREAPTRWRSVLASGAALVAIAYSGWDYFRVSQLYLPPSERASIFRDGTFEKARGSWLFSSQVLFAQITTADLDKNNAQPMLDAALVALNISPEPRVVEKIIESALLLGKPDLATEHIRRYEAAWPEYYRKWAESRRLSGFSDPLGAVPAVK